MSRFKLSLYTLFISIISITSISFAYSTANSTPTIKFSVWSDRDEKQVLAGAQVSNYIYVLVTNRNVKQVTFSIDDPSSIKRTDTSAPFDFVGSKYGEALPLNTKSLTDGTHVVYATVIKNDGTKLALKSQFNVKNNIVIPDPIPTTTKPTPTTAQTTTTTKPSTTTTTQKPTTTTTVTTIPPVVNTGNQMAGVTIDDPWDTTKVVSSLDQLKAQSGKPITARIVFDAPSDGVTSTDYAEILPAIHAKHTIMAELLDSFYLKNMTVSQYQARTSDYFSKLKNNVDIWEIGNEVNGSWVGDPILTAQKIEASYNVIGNQAPTALTLHCDQEKDNIYEFSNRITLNTRAGIDYVFVSQYDADCIYTGSQYGTEASDSKGRLTNAQWATRFAKLSELYPNAKVGFGEVGIAEQLRNSSSDSTEAEFISYYYGLGKLIAPTVNNLAKKEVYIGGYFYWYYSSDMVPFNKNVALTTQLVNSIKLL